MFIYCFDKDMKSKFESLGFREVSQGKWGGKPTYVFANEQIEITPQDNTFCFSQEEQKKFIVSDTMYFV